MDQNSRKATDVLLSLESKIDLLLNHYRSQELNLKILSNKINLLFEKLENAPAPVPAASSKFTIEPVDFVVPQANQSRELKVSSDLNIAVAHDLPADRRVSRQTDEKSRDLAAKKDQFTEHPLNRKSQASKEPEAPVNFPQVKEEKFVPPTLAGVNSAQVVQRVLGKNNNSLFLAEVEVKSIKDDNIVHKTRTNGIGKWMGTLPPGQYRVTVKKRGANNKDSLEISQDINIDGFKSLVELPDLQVK